MEWISFANKERQKFSELVGYFLCIDKLLLSPKVFRNSSAEYDTHARNTHKFSEIVGQDKAHLLPVGLKVWMLVNTPW